MGCVKKVVPWLIDPVGMAVHKATGFNYTPGGVVNAVLNKPKMPAQPVRKPAATPTIPKPPPPPPPWHPAPAAEPMAKRPGREGSGSTASSDRTRGLIGPGKKAGQGTSLLG